jgi:hypothetical protein
MPRLCRTSSRLVSMSFPPMSTVPAVGGSRPVRMDLPNTGLVAEETAFRDSRWEGSSPPGSVRTLTVTPACTQLNHHSQTGLCTRVYIQDLKQRTTPAFLLCFCLFPDALRLAMMGLWDAQVHSGHLFPQGSLSPTSHYLVLRGSIKDDGSLCCLLESTHGC